MRKEQMGPFFDSGISMSPGTIHIGDFQRILFGEAPPGFLLEAVMRITFLYILLVLSMRLLGRRMASALNRNDMAALVSLAAAVRIPMQDPERGLLPALIIGIVVVGVIRSINVLSVSNEKIERETQGTYSILVSDGVLNLKEMLTNGISRQHVFSELRSKGIDNLGKVKRLYMETSGSFTLILRKDPQKGLSLLPEWDEAFRSEQKFTDEISACRHCGYVTDSENTSGNCPNCSAHAWENGVLPV
jgi:uncharacterized membrane protein YcaP (DUF421 family)